MTSAELLILRFVGDACVNVFSVAEMVHDAFFFVSGDDGDVFDAVVGDSIDHILENWFVCHREHDFRNGFCKRPKSTSFAGG